MSVELPTNCTKFPAVFKTGWPTVMDVLILPARKKNPGIPISNFALQLRLDRWPFSAWSDPPGECAGIVLPNLVLPFWDQNHRCDTIPRTDVRSLYLVPTNPAPCMREPLGFRQINLACRNSSSASLKVIDIKG